VYCRAWYIALEDGKALRRPPIVQPSGRGQVTTVYPQQRVRYGYPGQYMYDTQPIGMYW